MERSAENNSERNRELEDFEPGVEIYLLRHAEKPSNVAEPELPAENKEGTPEWHQERHNRGLAPRLPKKSWLDLGKFVVKDNSLSLKGIIESHDFLHDKDLVNQTINNFPKGKIKVLFFNTNAYRTAETNQIIAEEMISRLKKMKETATESGDIHQLRNLDRISIEKPDIDGLPNEKLEEEKGE